MERYGKDYLSYSSIKNALADTALFDKYMKGEVVYESPALKFGTMYDMLLFERDKAMDQYMVLDDETILGWCSDKVLGMKNPKMSKEYKEIKSQYLSEIEEKGKIAVPAEEWQMAKDMINRLTACGLHKSHLSGDYQVEFNKEIDTTYGPVKFRGFLDCLGDGFISDSKTSMSISKFRYSVRDFGYDIQAYLYTKAFDVDRFYWVVQEKKDPYLPALVECSEETLFAGEMKVNEALESIKNFLQYGKEPTRNYVSFKI